MLCNVFLPFNDFGAFELVQANAILQSVVNVTFNKGVVVY